MTKEAILYYILNFFHSFVLAYFLTGYLPCENKKKRFIKIVFFYSGIIYPILSFFYLEFFMKMLVLVGALLISFLFFFKESKYSQKLAALVLLSITVMFSELILDMVFLALFGAFDYSKEVFLQTFDAHLIILSIMILINFILCFMVLKFTKDRAFLGKKENVYLIFMCVTQIILFLAIIVNLFQEGYVVLSGIGFYLTCFVCIGTILGFLMIGMIKESERRQKEITMLMMKKEYEKQLEFYLQNNIDREFSRLRHDIINQITKEI